MALKHVITLLFILNILSLTNAAQESKNGKQPEKSGTLRGTVLRADTKIPLRNVHVNLIANISTGDEEDEADARASATTDEHGRFELPELRPGEYSLTAERAGMVMKRATRQRPSLKVSIHADEVQSVTVVMTPGCTITGRVMDEHGEPMQNAGVTVLRYGYTEIGRRLLSQGQATTNDKGEYRIFGLSPGTFLVRAATERGFVAGESFVGKVGVADNKQKRAEKVYAPTYYPNEMSAERATPLTLNAGDEAEANFNLAMTPAHHIRGQVTGTPPASSSGKTEGREMVMVTRQGAELPVSMALVEKNSSFDAGPLPAGKYKLVAMQMGEEGHVSGSTEVSVGSADVEGVSINVNSGQKQVSGLVHSDSDAKIDYSKLYLVLLPDNLDDLGDGVEGGFSFAGSVGYAQVNKDGTFKVQVAPGSKLYHVALSAAGGGLENWFTSKVLIGNRDVLESGFRLSEAGAGPIEVVISSNGATVEGTAMDGDKKPFPDAAIFAVPADPKLRKRPDLIQKTTADQQGRFKLLGVRPGDYTLVAVEDPDQQPYLEDTFNKQHSTEVQKLTLEAGKTQKVELHTISVDSR